jgi:hypothetical protein
MNSGLEVWGTDLYKVVARSPYGVCWVVGCL